MTRALLVLVAVLYLALIALALRPATDLEVAALFRGASGFVGATPAGIAARYLAWALPFLLLAALCALWVAARFGDVTKGWAPSGRTVLILAAAMAIGPGLIVHAGLKEISHRPRPIVTRAFGGADVFRPWYRADGACRHNCAFASGETAAAGWTIAAAALVAPPLNIPALVAALLFTAGTGLWRMALGAHWLSDVVAATLIMVVAALACRAAKRHEGPRAAPADDAG